MGVTEIPSFFRIGCLVTCLYPSLTLVVSSLSDEAVVMDFLRRSTSSSCCCKFSLFLCLMLYVYIYKYIWFIIFVRFNAVFFDGHPILVSCLADFVPRGVCRSSMFRLADTVECSGSVL